MKTELKDRVLYFDGTNQVEPEDVPMLFLMGLSPEQIKVNSLDDDIQLFNRLSDVEITTSHNNSFHPDLTWKIPDEYLLIDISEFILKKAGSYGEAYVHRAKIELEEISKRNLENLFRTLIFVIDTLKQKNKLWGVGRGSSCASLVLYLMGLHKVDPVRFNIPHTEFFHD